MQAVAVIGIGCLLPGSKTPQGFYQSLLDKHRFIERQPLPELGADDFSGMKLPSIYNDLDDFFLQTLYITREALRDSGQLHNSSLLQRTGLITSTREACGPKMFELFSPVYLNDLETCIQQLLDEPRFHFDYQWQNNNSPLNAFQFSYPAILSAQTLGLNGPAFTLDAACASSLYCIKFAAEYLYNGSADMMIAGGFMSGLGDAGLRHYFASLGVSADANDCRPLDRNSAGISGNDGGGVVALKRLADAERDGDRIYAVIDNIAWRNQSSKGKLVLAPSRDGQLATFEDTYQELQERQITPDQIDYIECHATGTPVGDKVELNAMEKYFSPHDSHPLFGSVKGNIGHLMQGAGIAALIKMIFSIREGTIPATCGITTPLASRGGQFNHSNLVTENVCWPTQASSSDNSSNNSTVRPRRGAINSFGFGGSHAHMVVSEYLDLGVDKKIKKYKSPATKSNTPLALIGMAARLGPLTDLQQIAKCVDTGVQALLKNSDRLRGIEHNKAVKTNFLPQDSFCPGLQTESYEFDFLHAGVGNDCHGEVLDKELLLFNACNRALTQAGIIAGEHKRVGVIVAARQNQAYVQFHLEQYLPNLISTALEKNGIPMSEAKRVALVDLARDAILNDSNGGFDFVATGIGSIVAARIAAAWGFNGPTLKLCNIETGLVRSLELAKLMLANDDLDAVLVAVADNDPALENRILLKKYGPALGLPDTPSVIDDSAFAFVLSNDAKLPQLRAQPLAYLSDIAVTANYTNKAKNKHTIRQQKNTQYYGSRYFVAPEQSLQNEKNYPEHASTGLSLSTSAALTLLKTVTKLKPQAKHSKASQSDNSLNILGEGIDKQIGRLRVSPAPISNTRSITDSNTVTPGSENKTNGKNQDDNKRQRSLVRTVHPRVANISAIMLSKQARDVFAKSDAALARTNKATTTSTTRSTTTATITTTTTAAGTETTTNTAPITPGVAAQAEAQANSKAVHTAIPRNTQPTSGRAISPQAPVLQQPTASFHAQLFKQNCQLQQNYYINQRLLFELLNEGLANANQSITTEHLSGDSKNLQRPDDY